MATLTRNSLETKKKKQLEETKSIVEELKTKFNDILEATRKPVDIGIQRRARMSSGWETP